jgi:hypothetical protein
VQINWCLKGIAESGSFKDTEAADVLASAGILSNRIRTNGGTSAHQANISGSLRVSLNSPPRTPRFKGRRFARCLPPCLVRSHLRP